MFFRKATYTILHACVALTRSICIYKCTYKETPVSEIIYQLRHANWLPWQCLIYTSEHASLFSQRNTESSALVTFAGFDKIDADSGHISIQHDLVLYSLRNNTRAYRLISTASSENHTRSNTANWILVKRP